MYRYTDDDMTTLPDGQVAWAGIIRDIDGNVVCDVWNNGDGGCNRYKWADELSQIEFTEHAKKQHPESLEPLDDYTLQLWEADYGTQK